MGNVYMEAEQVRFKDSTYHNLQTAVSAALEGGGGGGTTVIANPEGSATADLAKLQVGTTIYGIPAEAGDISYDNTSSGMTADDVQEAIDELNTGIGGISELIPSDATSSNKLATADDIPDAVTGNPAETATAGDLTKLQIGSDIYSIPSGGSGGETYSTTETAVGTWNGATLYRKIADIGQLPNSTVKSVSTGLNNVTIRKLTCYARSAESFITIPFISTTNISTAVACYMELRDNTIVISTGSDRSDYTDSYAIIEYTKNS